MKEEGKESYEEEEEEEECKWCWRQKGSYQVTTWEENFRGNFEG